MTERDGDEWPDRQQVRRGFPAAGRSIWEDAVSEEEDAGQGDPQAEPAARAQAGRNGDGHDGGKTHSQPAAGSDRRPATRPGTDRRQSRPRQSGPGADILSDFQRWLMRSGARSVRREISGQVRRTLGGGRPERADVWDTATTEIPPEVGESPECQWCPICKAARRMRESGPGLGDHLATAGDTVATAVQEALRAFDSVLNRTTGPDAQQAPRRADTTGWRATEHGTDAASEDREDWVAARDSWAAAHGGLVAGPPGGPSDRGQGQQVEPNAEPDGPDEPDDRG